MILFITDHDDATHANFCVGQDLIPFSQIHLVGTDATRANLLPIINDTPFSIFAMSHGSRDCLLAHEKSNGIEVNDSIILNEKVVFAWACNTAIELGRAVRNSGGIWWGYTGLLQSPTEQEPFREMFSEIFQFISNGFQKATSTVQISALLRDIKDYCENMLEKVDIIAMNDPDVDVSETYLCLNQLWGNLRVWCPAEDNVIYHPESPVTILHY